MAKSNSKPIFDGATLSPKLKSNDNSTSLPIGKVSGEGGADIARAYKHAAGKSSTYNPHVVDMIYHMSRDGNLSDEHISSFVGAKLRAERDLDHQTPPATWDQLVFLSANLTRLVIDPYREKCNSKVTLGPNCPKPLHLDWPIVLSGADFDNLPAPLPSSVAKAARDASIAMSCNAKSTADARRIVTIDITQPLPDLTGAAAVELTAPLATHLAQSDLTTVIQAVRNATNSTIPVGIVAPAFNAIHVIDHTLDAGVDFYMADAQWTAGAAANSTFPELAAAPAIHVLADTVERLRHHNREETIQVIYRGGIRGGADAGKAICLGATAVSLGLSAVIGMGFKITSINDEAHLLKQLGEPCDPDAVATCVYHFAKSVNMEVTMLARACGKSSVTNMEPEDLRSLTIAVSAATGVPVTGKDMNFRTPAP